MAIKTEVWKPIEGYEERYSVSNHGNVKSKDMFVTGKNNSYYLKRGRVLKQSLNGSGYLFITLCKSSICKPKRVHKLVAHEFIYKRCGDQCVNHIDGDKRNNHVNNLEWCTFSDNAQHALKTGLRKTKAVIGKDIFDGSEISFKSMSDASRAGFNLSGIHKSCHNLISNHKGYIWSYIDNGNLCKDS